MTARLTLVCLLLAVVAGASALVAAWHGWGHRTG